MPSFVCLNWLYLLVRLLAYLLINFEVGGLIELTGIHLFFYISLRLYFFESISHHCVIVALFNPFFHCAQLDFNRTSFIIFNWACLCVKQTMPVVTTAMTPIKKKVISFPFHICLFNCLEYYFFRYIYECDDARKKNSYTRFLYSINACASIEPNDFNSMFFYCLWKDFIHL